MTVLRYTLSEQRARGKAALERMNLGRLKQALPCVCGDPFVYHCFYALHGTDELTECFPFCDEPCAGAIELCECCEDCSGYVHPLGDTPEWWVSRRMPRGKPAPAG